MIRTRMIFCGLDAEGVALSIEPDNLPEMLLKVNGEGFTLEFATEKIGTLLSTADDLLMNIKIAEETISSEDS
jgi:hypothetical protein